MFATTTINGIDFQVWASNMGDFDVIMLIDGECIGSVRVVTSDQLMMFLAYGVSEPTDPSDFQNGGLDAETADAAYAAVNAILETAHRIDIFGIIYGGKRRPLPRGWVNSAVVPSMTSVRKRVMNLLDHNPCITLARLHSLIGGSLATVEGCIAVLNRSGIVNVTHSIRHHCHMITVAHTLDQLLDMCV